MGSQLEECHKETLLLGAAQETHCVVMVLLFASAVTIARVQGWPLVIGGQGSVGCGQRVVENGPGCEESCSSHQGGREGAGFRGRRWGREVLIADAW